MATKVHWLPTGWFTEQWHSKCKHTWTLYLLAPFFRCSPKFFGIVCPSPSLLGALLVLCFRAMQERSFELYFSVYIFTCTFVSFTCGISVLVCSAVILSLRGDCTASEVRGYGFDFTEHWHSHTLSYHLLKDWNFCTLVCEWRLAVACFVHPMVCSSRCGCTGGTLVQFWGGRAAHFLAGCIPAACLALACQNKLFTFARHRTCGPNSVERNWRKIRPKCVANRCFFFVCECVGRML